MRPIIFLDVDGVLNTFDTEHRIGPFIGLDPAMVERAKRLISDVDAEVVLSSTWRLHDDLRSAIVARIPVIGFTPELPGGASSRGKEIRAWLNHEAVIARDLAPSAHSAEHWDLWRSHAVIDDDRDMVPGLTCFFTDFEIGLTDEVCGRVREWFS